MATTASTPPTPTEYQILLCLLDQDRHGYGIMQAVDRLTEGRTRLGAGTLYGAIKRLIERGLIEESGDRPDPALDDERRRYYRLTGQGREVVEVRTRELESMVRFANQHLYSA